MTFIDFHGRVYKTHSRSRCALDKVCVIHNPTVHGMSWWPALMREDKGYLVERICPHGVGHPDPDSLAFFVAADMAWMGTHGCDGCCSKAEQIMLDT